MDATLRGRWVFVLRILASLALFPLMMRGVLYREGGILSGKVTLAFLALAMMVAFTTLS